MGENSKELITNTNAFIIESIGSLASYKEISISIDWQNFAIPNFSTAEKERLADYNAFINTYEADLKNKPCIYVFEIKEGDTKEIIKTYKELQKTNKSAVKKTINCNTTCLYVGKSKSTLSHRLKVHFGYKDTTENGLQLLHWAKELDIKLQLNIYVFQKELDFLLPLYEANFSKAHQPLIGHL